MPVDRPDLVEVVARTVYEREPLDDPGAPEGSPPSTWDELPLMVLEQYRDDARAVLAALASAGALMPDGAAPVRLVAVEVFGQECDHPDHRGQPQPCGWGLCDAVQAWSDCNRANGHIFRVDDTDPQWRRPEDVITVWAAPGEAAKLAQLWGDGDGHNPPTARLMPDGGQTREEWAIRVDEPHPRRHEKAGDLMTHFSAPHSRRCREVWAGWTPMRRTVTTFADGSTYTSAWETTDAT